MFKVSMVAVAQLVESRIVIPVVVGSSPISHPIFYKPHSLVGLFCVYWHQIDGQLNILMWLVLFQFIPAIKLETYDSDVGFFAFKLDAK